MKFPFSNFLDYLASTEDDLTQHFLKTIFSLVGRISVAYHILITLFSDLLKWNSSIATV